MMHDITTQNARFGIPVISYYENENKYNTTVWACLQSPRIVCVCVVSDEISVAYLASLQKHTASF